MDERGTDFVWLCRLIIRVLLFSHPLSPSAVVEEKKIYNLKNNKNKFNFIIKYASSLPPSPGLHHVSQKLFFYAIE